MKGSKKQITLAEIKRSPKGSIMQQTTASEVIALLRPVYVDSFKAFKTILSDTSYTFYDEHNGRKKWPLDAVFTLFLQSDSTLFKDSVVLCSDGAIRKGRRRYSVRMSKDDGRVVTLFADTRRDVAFTYMETVAVDVFKNIKDRSLNYAEECYEYIQATHIRAT